MWNYLKDKYDGSQLSLRSIKMSNIHDMKGSGKFRFGATTDRLRCNPQRFEAILVFLRQHLKTHPSKPQEPAPFQAGSRWYSHLVVCDCNWQKNNASRLSNAPQQTLPIPPTCQQSPRNLFKIHKSPPRKGSGGFFINKQVDVKFLWRWD